MSRYTDLVAFVRGLEMISKAVVEHQGRNLNRVYNNSSIKEAVQKCSSTNEKSQSNLDTSFPNLTKQASNIVESVQQQDFTELKNQASRVIEKVQQKDFTGLSHQASKVIESVQKQDFTELTKEASKAIENLQKQNFSELSKQASRVVDSMQDNMMASSQSVKDDVKPDLAENESTLRYETTTKDDSNHIREEMSTDDEQLHTKNDTSMKVSHDQANDPLQGVNTTPREPPIIPAQETSGRDDAKPIPTPIKPNRNKPIGAKLSQSLSDRARERRVPSSRLGRLMSYGSLAAGLGVGAMAEVARRGMGLSDSSDKIGVLDKNPLLSDANAERIVNTLCRVRGAALKLGQMLSIQDSSMINPDVQRIFERVRQSADFMPKAQLDKAMRTELGNDWRNKFESFDDKPFAAASIGQVHRGTTLDGREVAVKIQYPGVADSINSDINNLMAVLNIWQILPKGLYVEEFIETAKEELSWECDYEREAASSQKFRALVKDDPVFYVPEVISELSSKRVMTSELVSGAPLDSAMSLDQNTKNFIAENLLRLCLQELFVFNYMQTDPNWSNFLYDKTTKRICLLDFGSAREYSKENFVDGYLRIIKGAADGKKDEVLEWSKKLGFLTGYESKAMQNAHVDAVMILGEAFSEDIFDFSTQTTTQRIQTIIPVMLKHRLTPPPEETYSLHRKLSGSYLLCTKFSAKIQCKKSLDEIWKNYHFLNLEAAPTSS